MGNSEAVGGGQPLDNVEFDFINGYNKLASIVHDDNVKKGLWPPDIKSRNKGEAIALMHSELSECLEGVRKPGPSDHIPEFTFEEEELADCVVRILDYGKGFRLRVAEALIEKLRYNRTRPYRHGKTI